MSGDPEQEYFSDGISDDIITDLSKIAGLTVIARNSSFTYKGRSVDIRTVGRELGVQSVLEGSIRRAGKRVRIAAQLIDTTNGGHLWADRYDRDLTDIFEVQDDVTHRIVDAMSHNDPSVVRSSLIPNVIPTTLQQRVKAGFFLATRQVSSIITFRSIAFSALNERDRRD